MYEKDQPPEKNEDDPLKKLEKQSGETQSAHNAFQDYCLMGKRSLRSLAKKYQDTSNPPTKSKQTLLGWSKKNGWQNRLKIYDKNQTDIFIRTQRTQRKTLIEVAGRKAAVAIATVNFSALSPTEAHRWLDLFLNQSRKETGDDVQKTEEIGDTDRIILVVNEAIDFDKL